MKPLLFTLYFPCFLGAQVLWTSNIYYQNMQTAPFIKTDNSGNTFVWGNFYGSNPTAYMGTFLHKYDSQGHLIWRDLTAAAGIPENGGIAFDQDGNTYVALSNVGDAQGNGKIWINGIGYNGGQGFLLKYNSTGDFQWVIPMGANKFPKDIAVNSLGQIIVTEVSTYSCLVQKYDGTGTLLSSSEFCGKHLCFDKSDNLYISDSRQISKYSRSLSILWTYPLNGDDYRMVINAEGNCMATSTGRDQTRMLMISAKGELIWEKNFAFKTIDIAYANGHISMLCQSFKEGVSSLFVRQFDSYGNESKTIEIPSSANLIGQAITEAGESIYITAAGKNLSNVRVMRIHNSDTPTSLNENISLSESQFFIYPNPSKQFSFNFENKNNRPFSVKVYDVSGNCVYSKNYSNSVCRLKDEIDLSAFSKGIYSLQLTQDRYTQTRKLLVE